MSDHAKLSPSSAHRWMLCPGSVREEAKYPEERSSPAAIDGTHSHTLLEKCIKEGNVASHYVGETLSDHDGEFVVDEARAARVQVALEYIGSVTGNHDRFTVRSEEKVDAGQWIGRSDLIGTADVQIVTDDFIEIIDYKDGFTPVSAEDNWQLILYAAGCLFPYINESGGLPFEEVRMTIIQPKLKEQGKDPISTWSLKPEEVINRVMDSVKPAAEATDDPDAPLAPGESQCKWCKAKGNCAALSTKALADAQMLFGQVDMAKEAADTEPNDLSDDQIREILEAKPLLMQMIEAVEKEAMRRFDTGHRVSGLKIVRGRGSYQWNADEDEIAEVLKKMHVPKDHIYPAKLVSVSQAKKLTWENRKKEKKQLSERQIKRLEDNYIKKSPGKLTVVPESDSRPEVVTDAATIFKDVEIAETEKPQMPAWLM